MKRTSVLVALAASWLFGCSSTGSRPDGAAGSGGWGPDGLAGNGGGGTIVESLGGRTGQAGAPGIGGADGGSPDGGDDAHHDAIHNDAGCPTAVAQGACPSEGTVCTNGCTDACQFCNGLRCTQGRWQPFETAPAPCFACGPSLHCQTNAQFCRVQVGGAVTNPPSYQCRTTPAACLPTPSCICLRNQAAAETICAEGDAGAGQLTTTLLAP